MTRRCPECGEPMWVPGPKRRVALWLRRRLERLAFLVDAWTAPRYDPRLMGHFHLTDMEAVAADLLDDFRKAGLL